MHGFNSSWSYLQELCTSYPGSYIFREYNPSRIQSANELYQWQSGVCNLSSETIMNII